MKRPKTISLVLGSGGARGYAHIGVIEELTKHGMEIASISGASMGALVGALYASGSMQAYKEWVLGLDALDLASLIDLSWDSRGLVEGEKIFGKLRELMGEAKIEELPIRYTAVATDLLRNKEVWFQSGDLLRAVRASIAIPTFFTPVEMEGMLLVDGGALNPLPVAPTMADTTEMTLAVNVYADKPFRPVPLKAAERKKQNEADRIIDALMKRAKKWVDKEESEYHLFDIMDMTLDSMQKTLIGYRLGGYPADRIIEVSKDVCGTYDFHKASSVIEAGREAARNMLEEEGWI